VIITASGGPFRTWSAERMAKATPADALKHPNWIMGAKISIDSATLANKALEVIEARHFFGLAPDAIDILVHPQSVVHGMAEFVDGAVLAHMGVCDMRQPIQYMLLHPSRRACSLPRLDLAAVGRLDFEKPDLERFPLLALGLDAMRRGCAAQAAFDAANEAAVESFLDGKLSFGKMADAVGEALRRAGDDPLHSLDDVLLTHERARNAVREYVAALS
jgi:1-deoxy-D-xylulose-5-phosphate reductoisomerase